VQGVLFWLLTCCIGSGRWEVSRKNLARLMWSDKAELGLKRAAAGQTSILKMSIGSPFSLSNTDYGKHE
jgi:hypothetical protein